MQFIRSHISYVSDYQDNGTQILVKKQNQGEVLDD